MELDLNIIRKELKKTRLVFGQNVPDLDKVRVINRTYNLFAKFYRSFDHSAFLERGDNIKELQYEMELHLKFLKNEDRLGFLSYSDEEQNLNVITCFTKLIGLETDSNVNPLLFAYTVLRFLDAVLFYSSVEYTRVITYEVADTLDKECIRLSYGKDNLDIIQLLHKSLQGKYFEVTYDEFRSHFYPNKNFNKIKWLSSNSSLISLFNNMFDKDHGELRGVKTCNILPNMIVKHFADSSGKDFNIKSIRSSIKDYSKKIRCNDDYVQLMKKLDSYHKVAN